jgi:hypothetical protein
MSRLSRTRLAAGLIAAALTVAVGGCGDKESDSPSDAGSTGSATPTVKGDWLLRFVTAEGADGERERSVYVSYDPSTGQAKARSLPPVTASDARQDEQVLLVSADHRWALQDTAVPKAQRKSGKLVLYSVTDQTTQAVDLPALTGQSGLRPVAGAFDPTAAGVLRVVDADQVVWKVDLSGPSATKEGQLPKRSGWIFGNGFDKTTGEPYIESIDSDQTEPAGNGDSDTRPIERQGGTLVRYDGETLVGLPKPPCGFAGGFQYDDGSAWLFCADTPSIAAYRAGKDASKWEPFGTPSPKIVPAVAADLSFVLPPLG